MRGLLLLLLPVLAAQTTVDGVSYLDNGVIRIGVDLRLGGAITYLAAAGQENLINSADYGRQIQQSYYSGPTPYGDAHPSWRNWPWNPIGTGDVYRNTATVVETRNDGRTLYVRSIPLQWALNHVACECTFESWIELEGNVARVRARLNNARTDRTQYRAYDQELPAVYTNGTVYRLFTYDGDQPFTGGALRQVQNSGPPWVAWYASENWAALLDAAGRGLGVFHPGVYRFIGGFHGTAGVGGPKDGNTGYVSPVRQEILDHDIAFGYEYRLIVGDLKQIRDYVYAHQPEVRPDYQFRNGREHWTYQNAGDSGRVQRGVIRVALDQNAPALTGPPAHWRAADVPKLYLRGAWKTKEKQAGLWWTVPGQGYAEVRSLRFDVRNDGKEATYTLELAAHPEWKGVITGLRLRPVKTGGRGEYVDLRYLSHRGNVD